MSFGYNSAGPTGAPIFGNQGTVAAGAVQGNAGAPANGATPFFNASFESIMCAMSRGEIPANIAMPANALGPAPTLLQSISQGVPQTGTNGIGVLSGYAANIGVLYPVIGTTFGNPPAVDGKQMASAVPVSSPIQYGGN